MNITSRLLAVFAAVAALGAATPTLAADPATAPTAAAADAVETGLAAVYSDKLHGRPTASGQRYDRNRLTAAHKTLPFGTLVKVTNPKNDKSVTVRINDRGPVQAGRILDLSPAAARSLGMGPKSLAEVNAQVVGTAPQRAKS